MQIPFHFWKNSKSGFVPKMENLIKIRYLEKLGVLKDWLNFPQVENYFQIERNFLKKVTSKIGKNRHNHGNSMEKSILSQNGKLR